MNEGLAPQVTVHVVTLLIWTLVGTVAVVYAHRRIARYTTGANVVPLHLILIATGLGVGFAMMDRSGAGRAALSFLAWFGAVHIPAACILFLKGQRRAGKS